MDRLVATLRSKVEVNKDFAFVPHRHFLHVVFSRRGGAGRQQRRYRVSPGQMDTTQIQCG